MEKLEYSIEINAPRERVWSIMWDDKTFRDWANIIDEGMYLVGELKAGAEVEFMSATAEYGVRSLVEQYLPNELVVFKHLVDTTDEGRGEREKEWTGGEESYALREQSGSTLLTVTSDTPSNQIEIFKERLPKALGRIKELAEMS